MPYVGSLPKSGCRNRVAPFMPARYASELASTGSQETSRFHSLSLGKTLQPPTAGAAVRRHGGERSDRSPPHREAARRRAFGALVARAQARAPDAARSCEGEDAVDGAAGRAVEGAAQAARARRWHSLLGGENKRT